MGFAQSPYHSLATSFKGLRSPSPRSPRDHHGFTRKFQRTAIAALLGCAVLMLFIASRNAGLPPPSDPLEVRRNFPHLTLSESVSLAGGGKPKSASLAAWLGKEEVEERPASDETRGGRHEQLPNKADAKPSRARERPEAKKSEHAAAASDASAKTQAGAVGPTSPEVVEALLSANYLGCFSDAFGDRDLPQYFPSFTMHPAQCMSTCHSEGFKFAGLQDGKECWCGNNAPRHQKVAESQCRKKCSGNELTYCGGSLRNSVYKAVDTGFSPADPLEVRPSDFRNAASSVVCQGDDYNNRVCKFRNLYSDTSALREGRRVTFIFMRGPGTVITNMDGIKNAKSGEFVHSIIELTSIPGISFGGVLVIDIPSEGARIPAGFEKYMDFEFVHVLKGTSLLFARYLAANIMHHIHDDLLNVFMTMVEYTTPYYDSRQTNHSDGQGVVTQPAALFDPHTRLVMVDQHGISGYTSVTQYLSDLPVTDMNEIVTQSKSLAKNGHGAEQRAASEGTLVRFESAIVGLTRHCNWYQYGYSIPQGPIEGKDVDGFNVRLFTQHILQRIPPLRQLPASVPLQVDPANPEVVLSPTLKSDDGEVVSDPSQRYAVIFSRTRNRKILNEPELAAALSAAYPNLKVVIIRLEETAFPVIVRILERTQVAVGMHGSILILGMFMPKDSLLLEMYPYAVPAENYTPYRTMANLKNMGIKYAAWMNSHQENNVGYPNRHRLHGGISHLSQGEQDAIINSRWVPTHTCCENPYWLFRIYQDTKVHIAEVMDIIKEHVPQ